MKKSPNSSNNKPFIEKFIEYIPRKTYRRYIEYVPFPIERIVETIEYERIEREYLNVPTDEYLIQQSSRLNINHGEALKKTVYSPVVLTHYKSKYVVPVQATYPKLNDFCI